MRGRDKFLKLKPVINILCGIVSMLPKGFRRKRFYRLRNKKGKPGMLIRYIYLKTLSPACGDNVSIHENVYLLEPDKFTCGDNVSIHPMCYMDATGEINIGSDVSVAHGVTIMSTTHLYEDINTNIKDQGIINKKTVVKDNVWIGAKATLVAGITVESGCVIGANSVVTHNCDQNSVMAGTPARKIKVRGE